MEVVLLWNDNMLLGVFQSESNARKWARKEWLEGRLTKLELECLDTETWDVN